MDHRGSLLLALLICVYTLTVDASRVHEPVFKGQSLRNDFTFLKKLYMGYTNPEPQADTVKVIEKNTLCGIQNICVSFMRMSVPTSYDAKTLKSKIELFNEIPRDALVILYNINGGAYDSKVLFSLWLLYLYVQDFFFYWEKITVQQMAQVHKMITRQLAVSMKDCPGNNLYDVSDPQSLYYSQFNGQLDHDSVTNPTHFPLMVKHHFDEIRPNLTEGASGEIYKIISADNLLFGTENYDEAKSQFFKIQHIYGKSIIWGDTSTVLREAYAMAKDPINLYSRLQGTRKYRSLYLTVIKMVVLRMFWIHFVLITDKKSPESTAAMHKTAKSFGNIIGLNDDNYKETVNLFQVESPSPEFSKAAIEHIRSYLNEISSVFQDCIVSELANADVLGMYSYLPYRVDGKIPTDLQKNYELAAHFIEEVKGYVHTDFANSVLALSYAIPVNF